MKKILLVLSLMAIVTGMLTGCGATTDSSQAYKGESPQTIYAYGKSALKDRSYSEAIKRFEALDVQYPYGPETEKAEFYLIYAYYMKDEYALSAAAADRFIHLHPAYQYVDYAYYMRGLANFYKNMGILERIFSVDLATRDLTQIRKAYFDFRELVERFPNSVYAPPAHQYMVYLRNLMASHTLETAQFYYDRKAYVAAANRANDVVAHYQGAPAVVDALVLMARSYQRLGMKKEESDTLQVLKYNYPNKTVTM